MNFVVALCRKGVLSTQKIASRPPPTGTRLTLGAPVVLTGQICYLSSYQPFQLNDANEIIRLHRYLDSDSLKAK